MSAPFVGRGIDRVDAHRKVTGTATYAGELSVTELAHAVIVGATIARGRVTRFDLASAMVVSGVIAILTHENAPRIVGPMQLAEHAPIDRVLQVLQDGEVHYDGQPIAVVVAETVEQARHAAGLVVATYAEETPTISIDANLAAAYAPETTSRGPTDTAHGDFDAAWAKAAVQIDRTYTTPPQNHNPLEAHTTVASWQGDDQLTLWDSTQGGFIVREKVARLFGLPKENVRVISSFVGGAFGSKGAPWSHVVLSAMAAKVTGRAVKLTLQRHQMFHFVGHRPPTIQRVCLGAETDGKLVALRHDLVSWTSRFDEFVEPAATWVRPVYACANVTTTHRLVRLDVPTPTFMRAPGAVSGAFAFETAMDELAYALDLDPLELRLVNYADIDFDAMAPYSSKELRACYTQAAARFGWSTRNRTPRSSRDGQWLVGTGMATVRYPAHLRDASAIARVRSDGTALVQSGTHDLGTGTYTIMTQIAADALGMSIDAVRFELGDTAFPAAPLAAASQTAASVGSAVKEAASLARAALIRAAVTDPGSPLHGLRPEEVDAEGGELVSKNDTSKRDAVGDVVGRAGVPEISVRANYTESEARKALSCQAFGAQFCEVRVDELTGEVRVSRIVGAFAAGKIINPKTARSQILGGIVWGIGNALFEDTVRDVRDARVVTSSLQDYHVAVNADVEDVEIILVDEIDPHVSAVGAKGIGELGITGVGAAIGNAVFHATGRRIRDLPITLDKLL